MSTADEEVQSSFIILDITPFKKRNFFFYILLITLH